MVRPTSLVAGVLLLTAAVWAQTPPPPGQATALKPPVVATGMVLGLVVDSSGNPISGAFVNMSGLRVMTNNEGRFLFTDLQKGNYQLVVTKPGYLEGAYGRTHPGGLRRTLELDEGERDGSVKITLWRTGSIVGAVYDDAGEPLVGVPIWSLVRSYLKGRAYWNDGPSATTDDRGVYRLGDLPPGEYALCVVNAQSTMPAALVEAYGAARAAGTTGEIQSQYSTSTIGFSARIPTAGIRVGDAVLHTVGPYSGGMIPPTPGENGVIYSFQTTCAPNSIGLTSADIVTLSPGEERAGADIRLQLVPGTVIEGIVTGPEGPEPNVGVRLSGEIGAELNYELTWESALTISDARGHFTFLGVPPGRYVLRALKAPRTASQQIQMFVGPDGIMRESISSSSAMPLPNDPTLSANIPIVVGADGLANMNVRLAPGFRVSGRVQFDGKTTKPTPDQMRRLSPYLEPADGHSLGYPLSVRMNPDGTFTTLQIPAGRYLLRASSGISGWTFKAAISEGKDIGDQPFDLRTDLANVTIVMTDSPSEISGMVRDENARIDTTAGVVVFSTERIEWSNFGETPRRLMYVRPSATGRFRVAGLPPGNYFVAAIDDSVSADWQDPRRLEAISRVAERVTLSDGEKRTIDLQTKAIR